MDERPTVVTTTLTRPELEASVGESTISRLCHGQLVAFPGSDRRRRP
jgi:hypothetical protein